MASPKHSCIGLPRAQQVATHHSGSGNKDFGGVAVLFRALSDHSVNTAAFLSLSEPF
jgi:hypothetical protein